METNNLNALKERLQGRKDILASLNKPGRPDALSFHFFNREFTMPMEQPEKYQQVVDAFKECLEKDIEDFEKLVAEGEILVKKFADERAAQLKLEQERKDKLAAESQAKLEADAKLRAEQEQKRKDQEDRLREATIAQEAEKVKQEKLKTQILEAELAAKKAAK
jgi:hypothetical protein